jgi:hypothetical protein
MELELCTACDSGNIDKIKELLKKGADPNTYDGNNLLTHATYNGHIKIVQELLKHKANPNLRYDKDWTPLMYASFDGYIKIARALLQAGADVHVKDNWERNALDIAHFGKFGRINRIPQKKKVATMLLKHIILVPFLSKQFKRINRDIIRESINYIEFYW